MREVIVSQPEETNKIQIKTAELAGSALDWAVAKCEGLNAYFDGESLCVHSNLGIDPPLPGYSTQWAAAGAIIEREKILLRPITKEGHTLDGLWLAKQDGSNTGAMVQWVSKPWNTYSYQIGKTALEAAMRCFVASKLGFEVGIPLSLKGSDSVAPTNKPRR